MDRRSLLAVIGVVAGGSLGLNAASGCNSVPDVSAADAAADQSVGDSAGMPADCTGDPPVMYVLDQNGNQVPPDWSCYQPDAAALVPLDFDAGDGGDGDDGPGDDASDSGDDTGDDAAGDDSSTPVDAAPPPVDAGPDSGPPAATCRFHMVDFENNALALPNLPVDFFFSNDTTKTPDFSATTADFSAGDGGPTAPASGDILMPIPTGAVWAYRSHARSADAGASYEPVEAINWLDLGACTAGQTIVGEAISVSNYQELVSAVLNGGSPDPTKESITTGVRDCQNRNVAGGIIHIVDDATMLPVPTGEGASDFHEQYFDKSVFPDTTCTHTTLPQSLYAAINVPTDRPLHVHAYGRMTASDSVSSPPLLGVRTVPVLPGQIVIVRPDRLTPN
jgi:hypothetical protein